MLIPESRLAKSSKWERTLRGLNFLQTFWTNSREKAKRVHCGKFILLHASLSKWSFMLSTLNSYALQLLTPASILAGLSGRKQIEPEDVSEMNELFLDAKTSAAMIESGSFGGWDSWFDPRYTYRELSVQFVPELLNFIDSYSLYSLFNCMYLYIDPKIVVYFSAR